MKGIILAALCLGIALILSFGGFRIYKGKKYFKIFIFAFLCSISIYGLFFFLATHDLGFLPQNLLEPSSTIDFLNGLLWICLIFHLFWDGMYMFILTGFSTGILHHLIINRAQGLSETQLFEKYGANSPMSSVISHRISNLEQGMYILKDSSGFILTPKGVFLAKIALLFKKLLNLKEIG